MEDGTAGLFGDFARYASLATGFECEWLAPGSPLPAGATWPRATALPVPGSEQLICTRPRRRTAAGRHWLLFMPGAASLSGWDCREDVVGSAFVLAQLSPVAPEDSHDNNWLRAVILDAIPFPELEQRFPARVAPAIHLGLEVAARLRYDDWEILWAAQDDAGAWLVTRNTDDGLHVLAAGEWLSGDGGWERSWGGNVRVAGIR